MLVQAKQAAAIMMEGKVGKEALLDSQTDQTLLALCN